MTTVLRLRNPHRVLALGALAAAMGSGFLVLGLGQGLEGFVVVGLGQLTIAFRLVWPMVATRTRFESAISEPQQSIARMYSQSVKRPSASVPGRRLALLSEVAPASTPFGHWISALH